MRRFDRKRMTEFVLALSAVQQAVLGQVLRLCRSDEQDVVAMVETRIQGPSRACPHCQGEHLVRNGHASGLQRYKCRGCGKTFNALTCTPMAGLRMKGKWLVQQQTLIEGLSVAKAAAKLGVARSTAFRWRHRFLALAQPVRARTLAGVVEADETYFLYSSKGQDLPLGHVPRKARKRGGKASAQHRASELIPVLVARDRSSATADFVLEGATKANIIQALEPLLRSDAVLCTDGSLAMATAAQHLGIQHEAVNLSEHVRTRGPWHIQNVNAYHARLKNWLRRFNGVASTYLPSYLAWFRALDRAGQNASKPAPMLALALGLGSHH